MTGCLSMRCRFTGEKPLVVLATLDHSVDMVTCGDNMSELSTSRLRSCRLDRAAEQRRLSVRSAPRFFYWPGCSIQELTHGDRQSCLVAQVATLFRRSRPNSRGRHGLPSSGLRLLNRPPNNWHSSRAAARPCCPASRASSLCCRQRLDRIFAIEREVSHQHPQAMKARRRHGV
jgi:hypothetical protein